MRKGRCKVEVELNLPGNLPRVQILLHQDYDKEQRLKEKFAWLIKKFHLLLDYENRGRILGVMK